MEERLEQFRALLKEKGMKTTTQRLAILQVLLEHSRKHLTAEEIYELVKLNWPDIGLATVYRNIQLLSELNLIDRLNLDDGYVRYEIGSMNADDVRHHHHHLICLECGEVLMFEDDLLENLEQTIHDTLGFKVSNHEVKLYGICKKCNERTEQNIS